MSWTGIPSVIAITVSIPASIASSIAAAAKRAGTKTIEVLAPRSLTRLGDRVEDRHAVDVLAALLRRHAGDQVGAVVAVAEPVEGALAAGQAGDDELRVFADDDAHASRQLHDPLGGAEHRLLHVQVGEVGVGEQAEALLGVGAVEADDQRHVHVDPLVGLDDPLGDLVAAGDAAEDVEQHRGHLLVGGDHLERVDDRVGLRAAAGVEEVGGLAAGLGDDVERRHAEPGAVAEDADVAVELHVGEPLLLRHPLLRVVGGGVLDLGQLGVAEERDVVDRHLGVERDDVAVGGDDQRVDLDQRRVVGVERRVELDQHLGDPVDDVLVDAWRRRASSARVVGSRARRRVDVAPDERVGVLLGDLLDVHPAHPREHRQRLLLRAVEDDRGVVLGVDLRGRARPRPRARVNGPSPRGPRMSIPRIASACSRASSASLATLIPPALPRPPIWTWALITHG